MRSDTKRLDNKVFGRLTAISPLSKNKKTYWKCICICGKEKDIRADALLSGKTKSCGCYNEDVLRRKRTEYGETHLNLIYHYYKKGAKRRNIEFSISIDDVEKIIKNDCFYCGEPPSVELSSYKRDSMNGAMAYHGIDRFDNNTGYHIENLVSCCSECNKIKMDLLVDKFIDKIDKIYKRLDIISSRGKE